MSECCISIKIFTDNIDQSVKLISGFQELYRQNGKPDDEIKKTMLDLFGKSFFETIHAKLTSKEDVLIYRKFLPADVLENVELFLSSLNRRTVNNDRIWQDSFPGDMPIKEICPSQITLVTRSVTGDKYGDDIELYYDSDENYIMKAAVFCMALELAGYYVSEISTNDEYEPE